MRVILLVAALLLGGCTATWTEADGTRRIMGWGVVSLRIPSTGGDTTFAGSAIDMTTVGVAVAAAGDETMLTFGYLNLKTARLRDHALVIGDPLALGRLLAVPDPKK